MAPQPSSLFFISIALSLAIAYVYTSEASDGHESAVKFTYSGTQGPDKWGSLSPGFSTCSSGKVQSPINIIKDEAVLNKSLDPLTRDYKRANATLFNNGYHVGVNYDGDCGTLMVQGQKYALKAMHWHTPAEHQIDGVQFPAGLHLVHESDSGSFAVVEILYELGDADPFINKIMDKLGELAKDKCGENEEAQVPLGILDNKQLRKNTRKYYRYMGSLTTPPCSENVTWNILGKVRTISKEQIEALKAPLHEGYKQNARPLQSLNGRKVELYDELD